ncbi:DUF6249 domain-containing protein [Terricaulis sp.]|uniref:DUF6249 domain-containing protein n=1 Tax=Terricaulis sp. TaxID=2768686 RepID=UPI003782E17E
MGPDVFVPFVFFGFLTAVIVVPIMSREQTKRSAHNLIAQAISRGQPLDSNLIHQLTQEMLEEGNRARKSLGSGVILLALAAGLVLAGYIADGYAWDSDGARIMMFPAIIIGTVGLAYLLLAVIDFMTKPRRTAEQ